MTNRPFRSQAATAEDRAAEPALKLVRHLLPAWDLEAHSYDPDGVHWVAIWPKDLRTERCYEGRAETLDLAVLTAVLQALRSTAGGPPISGSLA